MTALNYVNTSKQVGDLSISRCSQMSTLGKHGSRKKA